MSRVVHLVLAALLVACAPAPSRNFGAIVGPGGAAGPVYKASPPTLTDGQGSAPLTDSLGDLQVNSATKLAGEDLANDVMKVETRFSYFHNAGTTAGVNVKSGAGFLHAMTINNTVASTVITLDDAVSATTPNIAIVTLPAALGAPVTVIYDVAFTTGLELVVATGAADVTLSYRQHELSPEALGMLGGWLPESSLFDAPRRWIQDAQ